MADWTSPLPDPATAGAATHLDDHDALVVAITEARTVIDAAEASIAALTTRVETLEAVLEA